MSLRTFLNTAEQFFHHLTMHHTIVRPKGKTHLCDL